MNEELLQYPLKGTEEPVEGGRKNTSREEEEEEEGRRKDESTADGDREERGIN